MHFSGGYWNIESDELLKIIKGKIVFKRCPDCLGRGYVWYDVASGDVYPDQSCEDKFSLMEYATTDGCEECIGLGYVKAYEE